MNRPFPPPCPCAPAPAWLAIALAAACACGPLWPARVHAAESPDAPVASVEPMTIERLAQAAGADALRDMLVGDTFDHAAGDLAGQRIVKGAPYCADAVHETVQSLGDGNRIVRSSTTRQCRDGEGRTRQEVDRGGRRQVWLHDPVARETWVLDPQRKTARRASGAAGSVVHEAGDELSERMREFRDRLRDYAERMRDWARSGRSRAGEAPPMPPAPPAAPSVELRPPPGTLAPLDTEPRPVVVLKDVVRQRDDQGRESSQVEVRVVRVEAGEGAAPRASGPGDGRAAAGSALLPLPPMPPLPPLPPLPGAVSWRAQTVAPRGPGVATPLGTREIEGVRANGERTTWTIEAGRIGNEKPIVITRDVWTAPELMLTVLTRDQDPRSGETSYRLVNLRRGEPEAALMRVPADYATPSRTPAPARPPVPPAKG